MDIPRYALMIALALVGWMLLVEWNGFQQQHRASAPPPTIERVQPETPVAGTIADGTGSDDLPGTAPTELPQLESTIPPVADSSAAASTSSAKESGAIQIHTDTLSLEISLLGGDIIAASLPRYHAELGRTDLPFQLLLQSPARNYTAQSGLIGPNGTDTAETRPVFTALRNASTLENGQKSLTVDLLHTTADGVRITKRFRLDRGAYVVDMEYLIDNKSAKPWEAALFGQLRRDNSADPSAAGGALGIQPFVGFATRTEEEPYLKHDFDSLEEEPYKAQTTDGWIALVQHYFISAWIPSASQTNSYQMLRSQSGQNIGRFTSPAVTLQPGASGIMSARFYAGPKDQYRLVKIAPGLELTVDYGWLWWIAQPLFALLYFFATGHLNAFGVEINIAHGIANWGVAIILLTVLVKAVFFQLSAASYKSMAKMRKLQPKMLELRERYGDDRQKLSQETMDLYRKEKVNPLGGCLPILIQMPVFLSLYWVLLESVELRQAPLAGWIKDLSVMDPYFVLPLLMGASMYYQQTLNPPPPDPMQAKVMQFMPIIFTVFFLFFPAGLVLYWLVNNALSIAQQWVITRQIERGT